MQLVRLKSLTYRQQSNHFEASWIRSTWHLSLSCKSTREWAQLTQLLFCNSKEAYNSLHVRSYKTLNHGPFPFSYHNDWVPCAPPTSFRVLLLRGQRAAWLTPKAYGCFTVLLTYFWGPRQLVCRPSSLLAPPSFFSRLGNWSIYFSTIIERFEPKPIL